MIVSSDLIDKPVYIKHNILGCIYLYSYNVYKTVKKVL